MSRCFQYPPPGYAGNEESYEALIKLIKLRRERGEKLQRERKKAKAERKKREKKEKKKENKEKEKQQGIKINKDGYYLSDRSSLSEEHEQPISIGTTKCSSSFDSSQNSCCKRKRRNVVSSTCGKKEAVVIREDSRTDPGCKKLLEVALQYEDMVNNWVPPPLQTEELEFEDQDCWLIAKKNSDNQVQKKLKPSNVSNCCGSSFALWPRAQFLPEADIYALPFTVPF